MACRNGARLALDIVSEDTPFRLITFHPVPLFSCTLIIVNFAFRRVMRLASTDELSAGVIDGVNMDEVVLVQQGGELSGSVTFTQDVTFLAGLTADTNVLDSCDFGMVGGGGMMARITVTASVFNLFIFVFSGLGMLKDDL